MSQLGPLAAPVAFRIVTEGDNKVISDGTITAVVLDDVVPSAQVFLRRAMHGVSLKPPAETIIPLMNDLQGRMLAGGMSDREIEHELHALAGLARRPEPRRVEGAVIDVDGLRVYLHSSGVVCITRRDLQP
jgi:hypothetical protein